MSDCSWTESWRDIVVWTGRSRNSQTGDIPQGQIGRTAEEVMATCVSAGCSMRPKSEGGNGKCYAWGGRQRPMITKRAARVARDPGLARIGVAIASSRRDARYARLASIGDPHVIPSAGIAEMRAEFIRAGFLGMIGYVQRWRDYDAQGLLLASVTSVEELDEAAAAGWRCALVLPWDHTATWIETPGGNIVRTCPTKLGAPITCNQCGVCDAAHPKVRYHLGFPDHGPEARAKKRKARKGT